MAVQGHRAELRVGFFPIQDRRSRIKYWKRNRWLLIPHRALRLSPFLPKKAGSVCARLSAW